MFFISLFLQTLVTLRYLAKGDFFSETGDIHGVSKSSVPRAVDDVVSAINHKLSFEFPTSEEELVKTKRQFYRVAGTIPLACCICTFMLLLFP